MWNNSYRFKARECIDMFKLRWNKIDRRIRYIRSKLENEVSVEITIEDESEIDGIRWYIIRVE